MQPLGVPDSQASWYNLSPDRPIHISEYTRFPGYLVLPSAAPDGSPDRYIKVCAATGRRKVRYSACKTGSPPLIPSMQDTPSGDIFIGASLSFMLPIMNGDQNKLIYAVNAEYDYSQYGPLAEGDESNGSPAASISTPQDRSQANSGVVSSAGPSVMYGPRGDDSDWQTGNNPFPQEYIWGLIALGGDPNNDSDSVYATPSPNFFATWPTPPVNQSAKANIDVSNPNYVYWDNTYGNAFTAESGMIGNRPTGLIL